LRKLFPNHSHLQGSTLHTLRYKPERRWVGQLAPDTGLQAVLRVYAAHEYAAAVKNAKVFRSKAPLRLAQRVGRSNRHHIVAMEWIDGCPLDDILATPDAAAAITATGAALAALHRQRPRTLGIRTRATQIDELHAVADGVGAIYPTLHPHTAELVKELGSYLQHLPPVVTATHGDFYSDQVLVTAEGVTMLDLDRAAYADPAADLGLFIAHLHRDVLCGVLSSEQACRLREALLAGYGVDQTLLARVEVHTAVGLMHLAPDPFRRRMVNWPQQTAAILECAQKIIDLAFNVAGATYAAEART
jgi:Ser/Thr protein kinase RdoA (MazF antagonist)